MYSMSAEAIARKEQLHVARAVYARLPPESRGDFNTTMLMDMCRKQGMKDPRTAHKLDITRCTLVRKDNPESRMQMVFSNSMIINGVEHG